jgi:Ni,Fe-hydrogenase I large subunit
LGIAVVAASGTVTEAYAHGNLWRGFENFLLGRAVNDAITFTQRICGVCPVPHGLAATQATDAVLGYSKSHTTFATNALPNDGMGIPKKAVLIRNLVLGAEFLMSSITHFYHLAAPSYVQGPHMAPWTPYFDDLYYHPALLAAGHGVDDGTGHGVAPLRTAPTAATPDVYSADVWSAVIFSYVKALRIRRLTFEAGALFAGRMPMSSTFIGGGVTYDGKEDLTPRIQKFTALIGEVGRFVLQEYIPIVLALKYLYPDCDNVNNGSTLSGFTPTTGAGGGLGRFLSWGGFPGIDAAGTMAIKGGVYDGGVTFTAGTKQEVYDQLVDPTSPNSVPKNLTEDIESSRYAKASQDLSVYGKDGTGAALSPANATAAYPGAISRTKPLRSAGYTYMKAPRWGGKSMEVGPFARLVVNGIYTGDPMLDPTATLFSNMNYLDILNRGLKVMDSTAISLCMDNRLPLIVFNVGQRGNLIRLMQGEPVGTLVKES